MQTAQKKANKGTPETLTLIQEIVNTRYGRTRADTWQSPEQLHEWLINKHLLTAAHPFSQGDHRRLLEVREALRELLRRNNGYPAESEYIEALNHLAKHAPLTVHFQQDGLAQLIPDIEGVDGVISLLLGMIFTSMAEESWTRLKVCRNRHCQAAFYDTSKNHSGTWCTMAICGSRHKARTYRNRQQQGNSAETQPPTTSE